MPNIDRSKGINVEQFELRFLSGTDYLDANFDIESYDRIKAQIISEHEVIVLVHGKITYVASDFEEAGWEFLMKVYLSNQDNQWTVVKTDEIYTSGVQGLGEAKAKAVKWRIRPIHFTNALCSYK